MVKLNGGGKKLLPYGILLCIIVFAPFPLRRETLWATTGKWLIPDTLL